MGIELTVRFIELLPALLETSGRACLLTSSPTLREGTEVLVDALMERAPRLGIDVRMIAIQALWSPARKQFHRAHGVRRIDNVILDIRRGRGTIERVAAPVVQRGIDWVQGLRYGAHW
jgi:hypothetical protein